MNVSIIFAVGLVPSTDSTRGRNAIGNAADVTRDGRALRPELMRSDETVCIRIIIVIIIYRYTKSRAGRDGISAPRRRWTWLRVWQTGFALGRPVGRRRQPSRYCCCVSRRVLVTWRVTASEDYTVGPTRLSAPSQTGWKVTYFSIYWIQFFFFFLITTCTTLDQGRVISAGRLLTFRFLFVAFVFFIFVPNFSP